MTHHEADLYTARLIYTALTLLFVAALLYASGALQVFEDGSMRLTLGTFVFSGCPNPLSICNR